MKGKRLAPLLLLAPLTLLCACGGGTPGLTFSANWYQDTTNTNITNTNEVLEYGITWESNGAAYVLDYDENEEASSYIVTLNDENVTVNGTQKQAYHLHADRKLSGSYSYDGATLAFDDYSHSDVWFLDTREGLRPIRSSVEVHSTAPVAAPTKEVLCATYHYSYTIEYAEDLRSAIYTSQDLSDETGKPVEKHIDINTAGTFLDNEEIHFALRGVNMSNAVAFSSIDLQTRQVVELATSAPSASKDPMNFEMNGRTVKEDLQTYHVSIQYRLAQPGPARTLIYAAMTDTNNNLYRNVLLRFTNPVVRSMGTLTYTLKKASFSSNK